jgi:hypothetical protein
MAIYRTYVPWLSMRLRCHPKLLLKECSSILWVQLPRRIASITWGGSEEIEKSILEVLRPRITASFPVFNVCRLARMSAYLFYDCWVFWSSGDFGDDGV